MAQVAVSRRHSLPACARVSVGPGISGILRAHVRNLTLDDLREDL